MPDTPVERCPACATPRLAFFRLCLTCGLDYDAQLTPSPGLGSVSASGAVDVRDEPHLFRAYPVPTLPRRPSLGVRLRSSTRGTVGTLGRIAGLVILAAVIAGLVTLLTEASR